MNLGYALKVFQLNLLRQSGIAVTPQQVGLKSEPVAQNQQIPGMNGTFGNILQGLNGGQQTAELTPPTPPSDPTDLKALTKYNQDLVAYQQQYQARTQQMMQMILMRMSAMQQSMSQQQNSSANSSSSFDALGIGGILGGDSSL